MERNKKENFSKAQEKGQQAITWSIKAPLLWILPSFRRYDAQLLLSSKLQSLLINKKKMKLWFLNHFIIKIFYDLFIYLLVYLLNQKIWVQQHYMLWILRATI